VTGADRLDKQDVTQRITVESGYGYGVVGADLHVFGDGVPVYLLQRWTGPEPAGERWLSELPSRMLDPRYAVVPFTGQETAVDDLRTWRQSETPLAVRWLYGPGGSGKTRLAAQCAAAASADGWTVATAIHGPGSALPPPGSADLRLAGSAGLLLLVDYADRWPHQHLTWLLSNAVLHQPGVPARVLLIGRTADAWPALRSALGIYQAATSGREMMPLPDRLRPRMFDAARAGFAERYAVDAAAVPRPQHLIEQPGMDLVLAVHMAALAAVDAHARKVPGPRDVAGLTVYLLDREHRHWADRHGDLEHTIGPGRGHATPAPVMNRVVYTAALCGAVAPAAGVGVLHRFVPSGDAGQLLADHAACYPPERPGLVLQPLHPDRLAEDFLALTLPGHRLDYPAQPWAAGTATEIMVDDRTGTGRGMTFLAAAAQRWPHVGEAYLYPLLRQRPDLARTGGSAALISLAATEHTPHDVLEAVAATLPAGPHPGLDLGAAALSCALLDRRLTATTATDAHAVLHIAHAERLLRAARFGEAVAAAEQAVALARRLVHTHDAWQLLLALTLGNAAVIRAQAGRWEDALTYAREAITLRESVTLTTPDVTRLADLCGIATNLSRLLKGTGHLAEALPLARQATDGLLELARAEPGGHRPELALASANLAGLLVDTGRCEAALPHAERAVLIERQLTQQGPSEYHIALAIALGALSRAHWGLTRYTDALRAVGESTALFRRAAAVNPLAHEPDLVRSLSNTGTYLSSLGRYAQALPYVQEAAEIGRRLHRLLPAVHQGLRAQTQQAVAQVLEKLKRPAEALGAAEEAVLLLRTPAADGGPDHRAELAGALTTLADVVSGLGRHAEALEHSVGALRLLTELARDNPDMHPVTRIRALHGQSQALAGLGGYDLAEPPARQAVTELRDLARTSPAIYRPLLSAALDHLGHLLPHLGNAAEALAVTQQAVTIRRELADAHPGSHRHRLAQYLTNLGLRFAENDRPHDALPAAAESLALYRQLNADHPGDYQADLTLALFNYGIRLQATGRRREAFTPVREAARAWQLLNRTAQHEAPYAENLKVLGLMPRRPRRDSRGASRADRGGRPLPPVGGHQPADPQAVPGDGAGRLCDDVRRAPHQPARRGTRHPRDDPAVRRAVHHPSAAVHPLSHQRTRHPRPRHARDQPDGLTSHPHTPLVRARISWAYREMHTAPQQSSVFSRGMKHDSVRGINRRRLISWGGLAAAGVPMVGTRIGHADPAGIPPDTLPGGAYDRYVAQLAAAGDFAGVVQLSHRGRTVLSRSYGMADREKGIPNREGTAFSLSSAGKPFHAVAILQLAQQGKLQLSDPVGRHLTGFAKDIADQVTIHHLLSGTSGLDTPDEDVERVFQSRAEVHEYFEQRARQARLVGVPGTPSLTHQEAEVTIPALIVEAVAGTTYWDYVQENIFRRCGMTSTAFYTRPQWLTDGHIAHPYMKVADGSLVDAVRNLDEGSPYPFVLGKNPGRAFVDAPGDGG
jgi:tetratricopeptide (TPR) repeat protein